MESCAFPAPSLLIALQKAVIWQARDGSRFFCFFCFVYIILGLKT